jgi:conjugal transfer/entry exclusion protein
VTAAVRDADTAVSLRDSMSALPSGGSMAALDAIIRPVDALAAAGIGWLSSYVEPLQQVVDRMAGKSAVIQTFADGWQRGGDAVGQACGQLERAASTATAQWQGGAADAYRRRAAEIVAALRGAAALSAAASMAARAMGEAAAAARQNAGDILTDLVGRLTSYVPKAVAAEGGVTTNVMANATTMISSCQGPMSEVEQRLRQTFATTLGKLTGETQVAGPGGFGASMVPTWRALKERLDSNLHLAQMIIQLPAPPLPEDARPATKAELDRIAQNPIFIGKLGYRVTIGEYAEAAALEAMGLQKNEQKFYPYQDSRDPADWRKHVIPDGVGTSTTTIISRDGVERHVLENGHMVDIKATSDPIGRGDEQFRKYVDLLGKNYDAAVANDPDTPRPSLIYVGTSEMQFRQSAIDYAARHNVDLWRAQMYLSGPENDPRISVGPPMSASQSNNDMPILSTSRPPQSSVPLFNSQYDELLRRRVLDDEQN